MTKVISIESVRRANDSLDKTYQRVNTDSKNFVSKITTSFGSKEFVLSKQALNDAARTAMQNMRK